MTEEEVDQHDSGEAWEGPLPVFSNRANLVVNDVGLTEQSSLATLRSAAEYLGIGTGGSKKSLWHRLNQQVQKTEHQQFFVSANRLYKEQNKHKGLVHVPIPRQPSQQERELHELVHLPYQPWCDVCVSCKSRADAQRPLDLSEEERRTSPSIQLDYGFGRSEGKTSSQTALTVVLVGVVCESRMLMAMPVESKGADLRGQAEQVTTFSLAMNHCSKKKGQTGRVERAIQTLRRQASALVKMAEDRCLIFLPGDHALWSWAYVHAAWVINRFSSHRATQMAPFELAYGRRYVGKVVCFGEYVMVLSRRPGLKQGPHRIPGIWVGKTEEDDLHMVMASSGLSRQSCEENWPTLEVSLLVHGEGEALQKPKYSTTSSIASNDTDDSKRCSRTWKRTWR